MNKHDELLRHLRRVEFKVDTLLAHFGIAAPGPESQLSHDIRDLAAQGKKIHAIKLYREQTGASLAEAKAAIDQIT